MKNKKILILSILISSILSLSSCVGTLGINYRDFSETSNASQSSSEGDNSANDASKSVENASGESAGDISKDGTADESANDVSKENASGEGAEDSSKENASGESADDVVNQVDKNEFQGVSNGASLADLYDYCIDSCVSIVCDVVVTQQGLWGPTSYETTSLGSGFVIDGGYIVTNHHVIDGAKKIRVVFNDNEEIEATLVGSDKTCDIAVLKLKKAKTVYPVKIGDSSAIRIGEDVIAIGTPSKISFAGTLTYGVISGLNRKIEIKDSTTGKVARTMYLIQTDATLNPGNSGGPLFNMKGEVVGINNMKLVDSYEGIGFSIPINGAMEIINAIIEGKDLPNSDYAVTSAYLGIQGETVSEIRGKYDLDASVPDGVLVISVERKSAIYKAGLNYYDVITKFNDVPITSFEDLKNELALHNAGENVTVEIYRISRDGKSGETHKITFNLDSIA